MYKAVKGSVVWEDGGTYAVLVGGGVNSSDPYQAVDAKPKIGVDGTDPGLLSMRGDLFERGKFPGLPDMVMSSTPALSTREKGDWDNCRVILVEAKTNWADMVTSIRTRRLARQVRTLLGLGGSTGLVVVAYPSETPNQRTALYNPSSWEDSYLWTAESVRLQSLGVVVVPFSSSYSYWDNIRHVLHSERNQRRAIAGDDRARNPRTALEGIPGVGPKTAAKILTGYRDVDAALVAYPEWATPKIRQTLQGQHGR